MALFRCGGGKLELTPSTISGTTNNIPAVVGKYYSIVCQYSSSTPDANIDITSGATLLNKNIITASGLKLCDFIVKATDTTIVTSAAGTNPSITTQLN